ncbi:DUF2470 domain-containing protein [Streptomyces sp. TS71-3]|uniref:DUF2470 domain-containing protein n=1 Tax=Streptomyces sp. TS71-3 TaxID=2733862 RepID=UPI001B26A807|nr:DUF2470 domain-containing protein [Streptomyces sp. TS71-3]GHJ41192.1 hypothetical protein Sm713_68010 [Streptomyces sp. TS71-3]
MPRSTSSPTQPTSAEQVRFILAAARSMTLLTGRGPVEVYRVDTGTRADKVRLCPVPLSAPDAASALPGEEGPAALELTDIAPVAVRNRVRARVTIVGQLQVDHENEDSHLMTVERALLRTDRNRTAVHRGELLAALQDPLATCEAGMLTHMADHHADLITTLLRLVDPLLKQGMLRALPLAMDRYGITMRLEYLHRHRDVRLAFPVAVRKADQTREQIHALLAEALHTSPRRQWATRLHRDTKDR